MSWYSPRGSYRPMRAADQHFLAVARREGAQHVALAEHGAAHLRVARP